MANGVRKKNLKLHDMIEFLKARDNDSKMVKIDTKCRNI
jgi:hypothetical protein